MMAPTSEQKPTCASQRATSFPEPNATSEELEAAAVRLNLLAEAEIYSTDALMVMEATGRENSSTVVQVRIYLLMMTILGVGVDVLHLPRLTHHLANIRLAKRILSPVELCEYLALSKEDRESRVRFLGLRCAGFHCRLHVLSVDARQMGSKGSRIQGSISSHKTNLARFYGEETREQSQTRSGVSPQRQPTLTQARSNTYVCES
jgi:hypothetical protein